MRVRLFQGEYNYSGPKFSLESVINVAFSLIFLNVFHWLLSDLNGHVYSILNFIFERCRTNMVLNFVIIIYSPPNIGKCIDVRGN